MSYVGDFPEDFTTVSILFTTHAASGAPVAPSSGFEAADVAIFKNGSATEKTSTNGLTMTSPFNGTTGLHCLVIDTSNDTGDGGFWVPGAQYTVVLVPDETVDSLAVAKVIGTFGIELSEVLRPTTAGRQLDVSAGGEAGIDWANIGSPTTTVALSGTTVKTATDVETDTQDIQSRLPAALVSGRIDASVGAMASGVVTATAIAADAITAAKIADGAIDAATFAAGAINAAAIAADAITDAKVASDVTIASVTGAVGSVAGAVGSVTGNVGGNVTGSVGSVATGGITAASFAADAITAAKIAADVTTELQAGLATASAVSTLQTSVDDLPTNAELATALGTADDAVLAQVALVKAKTDNLPSDPADASDIAGAFTSLSSHGDSAWATATGFSTLNAAGVRGAVGLASANLDTQLDALPTNAELATALGIADDAVLAAIPTANQNADALLDRANAIETGLTPRQAMRLSAAADGGKLSGGATTTNTIRNAVADDKDRIVATVDADGNRTAITYDLT